MGLKIAFFSEMGFTGKIPRTHNNMRTEFAWMVALGADHVPIKHIDKNQIEYDLGILIMPKQISSYAGVDIVSRMKSICKVVSFMQEGPSWFYQSLPISESIWFLNQMLSVDVVFAHNDIDKQYYEGLLQKPTYINPTLMITDNVSTLSDVNRSGVIMGGNLGRWYGGVDSYMIASELDEQISAPQMGRMEESELNIDDIHHLPYLEWVDWIVKLNEFKYAVHLNPNTIAGTFNLNCAYLGIPCIGNVRSNTQRLCFPELSVDVTDLASARRLANKLKTDENFYNEVSETARRNYELYFGESTYMGVWNSIIKDLKL